MNSNKLVFLALALLAPATAFPSPKFSCASVQELDKKSEDCHDNHRYTKAGQDCLQKLEAVISGITHIPKAQLKKSAEEAMEKEAKGAEKNYNLSPRDAERIASTAKIAKEYLSSYRDNIFYPEDWDAPKELIGDPVDFLDSQKCYADARDSLEEAEDTIDYYAREFGRCKTPEKK